MRDVTSKGLQPAWPSRGAYLALTLVYAAVAVYGSLVPLDYRPLSVEEAVQRFRHIPLLAIGTGGRADWVANILLFVPISFFAVGAVSLDRRPGVLKTVWPGLVVLACAGLSLAIEFTQLWFPTRTVSKNDILAESLGAVAGAMLWILCGQMATEWLRRFTSSQVPGRQFTWLLQAYLLGFLIYQVLPLDLPISFAELQRKYDSGGIVWLPFSDVTWNVSGRYQTLVSVLMHIPIGLLVAQRSPKSRQPAAASPARALLVGSAIVLGVELVQVVILSRYTSTTHFLLGVCGIAGGVLAMRWWQTGNNRERLRDWVASLPGWAWVLTAIVYSGLLAIFFLGPFEWIETEQETQARYQGFFRVPFAALYRGSEFNAVTESLKKSLTFAPLGVLLAMALATWRLPRFLSGAMAVLLVVVALGVSVGIEMLQVIIGPQTPDVTDVLLATAGAALGVFLTRQSGLETPDGGPSFDAAGPGSSRSR